MSTTRKTATSSKSRGLAEGYRSGLEETVAARLTALEVFYEYEALVIPYLQPQKPRKYTPDFVLPNGIVVETKGRFITADRQKHILVKEQYPNLDLRFLFSNANARISKQSRTTYAKWCEDHGFLFAHRHLPDAWLAEPKNIRSWHVIGNLMYAAHHK